MKYDAYGVPHCSSNELVELLYKNPDLLIENFLIEDPDQYNNAIKTLHSDLPKLKKYADYFADRDPFASLEEFDTHNQNNWFMPKEYKSLDIAEYVISLCKTDQELTRVQQELILFQERNLFDLLRFLKYLVDTMRSNNVVWGVGRGSSVSSYVLYLIGIHKIDSLLYDLDIKEFLK